MFRKFDLQGNYVEAPFGQPQRSTVRSKGGIWAAPPPFGISYNTTYDTVQPNGGYLQVGNYISTPTMIAGRKYRIFLYQRYLHTDPAGNRAITLRLRIGGVDQSAYVHTIPYYGGGGDANTYNYYGLLFDQYYTPSVNESLSFLMFAYAPTSVTFQKNHNLVTVYDNTVFSDRLYGLTAYTDMLMGVRSLGAQYPTPLSSTQIFSGGAGWSTT